MSHAMKLRVTALALASAGSALIAACVTGPSGPTEAELIDQGHGLAGDMCGECHAIGAMGASPNPNAPPLRTAFGGVDRAQLRRQLRQGLPAGHPDMPLFVFTSDQLDALLAYLDDVSE